MSNNMRFHEVATLKIRVYDDTMTVESHEKIFAEENPEGTFPKRQVYMRVSSDSSEDDDQLVGSERRAARRAKRANRPGPPAKIPTGELLTLEEASSRRVLFAKAHMDRQRYVNGVIRQYKPREVFVRKYRQLVKVHDGHATTRDDSSDSLDDLVFYDEDHRAVVENEETEDTDNTTSNDSFEEDDDDQNDASDSDAVEGGWRKKRRVQTSETQDDSTTSSMSSIDTDCND